MYLDKFIDSRERFDETSLPEIKKIFTVNCKDITDKDYSHAQKVFKELGLKNLGDYHDLDVQNDTLLLADLFENFGNT